jgi:hypothetical protein
MNIDLKRALALKQFLNEDFFVVNDTAYEGTLEDAQASFVETGQSDETFEKYVHENYVEVEEISGDDYRNDYLVFTDVEADIKLNEVLDKILEKDIYFSFPDYLREYFKEDEWKEDSKKKGRGYYLAEYDRKEHYETVDGDEFYIYIIN